MHLTRKNSLFWLTFFVSISVLLLTLGFSAISTKNQTALCQTNAEIMQTENETDASNLNLTSTNNLSTENSTQTENSTTTLSTEEEDPGEVGVTPPEYVLEFLSRVFFRPISVYVSDNGTAQVQAYDETKIDQWVLFPPYHILYESPHYHEWRNINEGGTSGSFADDDAFTDWGKTAWCMLDGWVKLRIVNIYPNTGYKLKSIVVVSNVTGTDKNIVSPNIITNSPNSEFYAGGDINVYIEFEPIAVTYDITYFGIDNGAVNNPANPSTYQQNQTVSIYPPTTNKTGYKFKGWTCSSLGITTPSTNMTLVNQSGDLSITANWTPLEFTITFNDSGGSGGSGSKSVTYDAKVGSFNNPTKEGYTFKGYFYNSTQIFTSTTYKYTTNITVTAEWEPIRSTLTFYDGADATGGTGSKTVYYEREIGSYNTPIKKGFTFIGYYWGMNGTNGPISSGTLYTKLDDSTVYAYFQIKTVSVTLQKDDGIVNFSVVCGTNQNFSYTGGTLSGVFALTPVDVSLNSLVVGYVWFGYEISGTQGVDYDYSYGNAQNQHITILPYSNITIKLTSRIELKIIACSNPLGVYETTGQGGSVKINTGGEYGATALLYIQPNTGGTFYAKPSSTSHFIGFYPDYDENGGVGTAFTYSVSNGVYSYVILSTSSSLTIYAIFEPIRNDITAYAYSSLTDSFDDDPNSTGGVVKVANSSAGVSSTATVALGYQIDIVATAQSDYFFIGWYTSLESLQADTKNESPMTTEAKYSYFLSSDDPFNIYAKFAKKYTITLVKTMGVTEVGITNALHVTTNDNGIVASFFYGQDINGSIYAIIDDAKCLWNTWELTSGTAPATVSVQIGSQSMSSVVMGGENFQLTTKVEPRPFDLEVYAIYSDTGSIHGDSDKGGKVQIQVSGKDALTPSQYNIDQVLYGHNDATITAIAENSSEESSYTFIGWYKTVDLTGNSYSDPYMQGTQNNTPIGIEIMENGLIYYAIFVKNYQVYVFGDDGVSSVSLTEGEKITDPNDGSWYYKATFYYNSQITLSFTRENFASFDRYIQLDSNRIELTTPTMNFGEDESINFEMPAENLYIKIATIIELFDTVVRTCLIDNNTLYHDSTSCGTVQLGENGTPSNYVAGEYAYGSQEYIKAVAKEGYIFYRWYVVNNGVSGFLQPTGSITNFVKDLIDESYAIPASTSTETLTNPTQADNDNYYVAVYIKLYTIKITIGLGIDPESFSSLLANEDATVINGIDDSDSLVIVSYPYKTTVGLMANTQDSDLIFSHWLVIDGSECFDNSYFSDEGKTRIEISSINVHILGSIDIQALTTENLVDFYGYGVTELADGTLSLAGINEEGIGGSVTAGTNSVIAGTYLIDLIHVNQGYEIDRIYTDSACENVLPVAPEEFQINRSGYTVYIKFIPQSYSVATEIYTTSVEDNFSLTSSTEGGYSYISDPLVKFGGTTDIYLYANEGFVLKGVYLDYACTSMFVNGTSLTPQISGTQKVYRITSDEMENTNQVYYVAFSREVFDINVKTITQDGISINIATSAYYGEIVDFVLTIPSSYNGYDLQIYKASDNSVSVSYSETQFTMPAFAVEVEITGMERLFSLTYRPNGGQFSAFTDVNGYIYGTVTYSKKNYSYFQDLAKTISVQGAPIPVYEGHTFTGYNTKSDGSGITYITYNGIEFTYQPFLLSENTTLYAMYDFIAPQVSISYYTDGVSSLKYNGLNQPALKAVITNYSSDLTYFYSWYKEGESDLISQLNTLKLRSVNQSGNYYCRVSIEDSEIFTDSSALPFTITKKALNVTVADATFVGDHTIQLNSSEVSGFVSGQSFVSGELTFASSTITKIYTSSNSDEITTNFIIQKLDGEIEEDSFDLSTNYSLLFNGTITIKPITGCVAINVGVFERTINTENFADVLSSTVLESAEITELSYSNGFEADNYTYNGIVSNYITYDNRGYDLSITFTKPLNYDLYKIFVGNHLLTEEEFTRIGTTIIINLTSGLFTSISDGYLANINIYLTKECLTNLDYGIDSSEISGDFASVTYYQIIQTYGSAFIAPTGYTRSGYNLIDWYYQSDLLIKVGSTWLKTGEATIYAKWALNDITADDVSLIMKDNSEIVETVSREYNGNTVELSCSFYGNVVHTVKWYKKVNNVWTLVTALNVQNIKNVSNSGEYSFEITATYNNTVKTYAVGGKTGNVSITQKSLDLVALNLDKVYDGTTSIGIKKFITNVGAEEVQLIGEFSSANVNLVEGIASNVNLLSGFYLQGVSGSLAENYSISNLALGGIISQFELELVKIEEKTYDTYIFNKTYTYKSSINQTITYILTTSSANAGIYTYSSETNKLFLTIDGIKTSTNLDVNPNNYNITLSTSSKITIKKAIFSGIYFSAESVFYDYSNHMLKIKDSQGNEITTLTNGVSAISYTYEEEETTGFTIAGIYEIRATITPDQNYESWTQTATLTIKKVQFSMLFLNNLVALETTYEYSGENIYADLTVDANIVNGMASPVLVKQVFVGATITENVVELGTYKLTASYDTTNFEIVGANYQNFTIIKKSIIGASDLIYEETQTLDYNGIDQANTVLGSITHPEEIDVAIYKTYMLRSGNYVLTTAVKNVDTYKIIISISLNDATHYSLDISEIEIILTITPFEITNTNSTLNADKTYDGTTASLSTATILVNLSETVSETLKFSGYYSQANVGNNISLSSIALANGDGTYITNYTYTTLTANANIIAKDLSIILLDAENYLVRAYENPYNFAITKTENQKYIQGSVNGEYFVLNIVTDENNAESSLFDLSILPSVTNNIAYLNTATIVVYDKNGNEILGGFLNYNLTFDGGLELLKDVIFAEVVLEGTFDGTPFNNIYSASPKSVYIRYTQNGNSTLYISYQISGNNYGLKDEDDIVLPDTSLTFYNTPTNVGEYMITLTANVGTHFQTISNEIELTYTIEKAPLIISLGNIIKEYSDSYSIKNLIANGQNGEKLSFNYSINNATTLALGTYTLNNNALTFSETSVIDEKNYEIIFEGTLTVGPKVLTVYQPYTTLALTYNGADQISEIADLTFEDSHNITKTLIKNSDYILKYFINNKETTEIRDAGAYTAIITATNYQFYNGEENVYSTSYFFTVAQKELTAIFTILESIIYNAENQTPVSVEFTGVVGLDVLNEVITYSNNQLFVRNAGTYTATVVIANSNYFVNALSATSAEFEVAKFVINITAPIISEEVWEGFSKFFGTSEPTLKKEFTTALSEVVVVNFARESGLSIGRYALTNPELLLADNDALILQNNTVEINADNKGFQITTYSGAQGVLTIEMIDDISIIYDASTFASISLADYISFFNIKNYNGNVLTTEEYNLTATFNFETETIRNAGEYLLILGEKSTTSHDSEQIYFVDDGHKFIIAQKEIDLTYNAGTITKVYDRTSDVNFNGILTIAENQIETADSGTVTLSGKYYNAGIETSNFGTALDIELYLSGENALNYKLKTADINGYSGNITKKELTIVALNEGDTTAFDKIYDRTTAVDISKLAITGTVIGDELVLTGNYTQSTVGEGYGIDFSPNNENYLITGLYYGNIIQKELTLDITSILEKEYDGNSNAILENLILDGIVEGDNVSILTAIYNILVGEELQPNSDLGTKYIVITLGGDASANYFIENYNGKIIKRVITLVFHYGDEEEIYTFNFVEDDESITKGLDLQEVFYGTAVANSSNVVNFLPTPTRKGYDFSGWYKNSTLFTTDYVLTDNKIIYDIEGLASNGFNLDLYANWNIKTYEIKVNIISEQLESDDYIVSNIGGNYTFNGTSETQDTKTFYVNYYSINEFVASANAGFDFNSALKNGELYAVSEIFETEEITANTIISIKFSRELFTLGVKLSSADIAGFTEDWVVDTENLVATISKRSGTDIILPYITLFGNNFKGYSYEENGDIFASFNLGMTYEITNNILIFPIFELKVFDVYIDLNGGTETVPNSYVYYNAEDKTIQITYGAIIPLMPELQKTGYTIKTYDLYKNTQLILSDITENETLFNFDGSTYDFTIFVNWEAVDNYFIVNKELDESVYGSGEFETPVNAISLAYNIDFATNFTAYSGFGAKTGSTVELKYEILNPLYNFKAWYVGETKLSNGTQIVAGTTYFVYANILQITGFDWTTSSPEFCAVYTPKSFVVEIVDYNTDYANILTSGTFIENDILKTYAGAYLIVDCNVFAGYEIISYSVQGANANTLEGNFLTVSQITGNVLINVQFDKKSYNFQIVKDGEVNGFSSVSYAINEGEYENYGEVVGVRTGDIIKLKISLNYGYQIDENGIVASREGIIISEGIVKVEDNKIIIEKEISSFTEEFNLTITLEKCEYNINLTKKLLIDGELIEDESTTENSVFAINQDEESVSTAKYLDIISFEAVAETETISRNSKTITIAKYEFVGWYQFRALQGQLLSEEINYEITITSSIEIYAVFAVSTYEVAFRTEDASMGKIKSLEDNLANSLQVVEFGESIVSSVKAVPESGYRFESWTITLTYSDGTIIIEDFESFQILITDLAAVKCDIVCLAHFENFGINIIAKALFADDTTLPANKISVSNNDISGLEVLVGSMTRENIEINAVVLAQGYVFKEWNFNTDDANYIIISNKYNSITKTQTLVVQFIGESEDYQIIAYFEKGNNNIELQFIMEQNKIEGGIISNSSGSYNGAKITIVAKTETTASAYLKVYKGYSLISLTSYLSSDSNINVQITDITDTLSADELEIYKEYYLIEITNFNKDATIRIYGERKTTTIHFAKLIDLSSNTYEENDFTGTIKYGTNVITVSNVNLLIPTHGDLEFMGWSLTTNKSRLMLNASGQLLYTTWNSLQDDINLYPIFEHAKIKVLVEINPYLAVMNNNSYYRELFNNLSTFTPIIIDGEYYFDVGASFGISLPTINNNFTFMGYSYYIINESGAIEYVSLSTTETATSLSSSSLFNLPSVSAFKYSQAINVSGYPELEDRTMYITMLYGLNITTQTVNAFTQNRTSIIGGTIDITNSETETYSTFGQTITVTANVENGYELKEWWINGVKSDITEIGFNYTMNQPTTFRAVFQGKAVYIEFGATEEGAGTDILYGNGNGEAIDGKYLYYVGDIISLRAECSVGYDFSNNWQHSGGAIYKTSTYLVVATDSAVEFITLTPLFTERQITIRLIIMDGEGNITKDNVALQSSLIAGKQTSSYNAGYFDEVLVKIFASEKYAFDTLLLTTTLATYDATDFMNGSTLKVIPDYFDNSTTLTFKIYFDKIYWYDLVYKNNLVNENETITINRDFQGTGKIDDPYRIETTEDFALWCYVINNAVVQPNTGKNGYNSENTYYEISYELNLSARFWTPIGTIENPLNATVYVYRSPTEIEVDKNDDRFSYYNVFDINVLREYGGLFGYLSETGNIQIKAKSYASVIITIGVIAGGILVLVLIIVVVARKRSQQISGFDQNQNPYL